MSDSPNTTYNRIMSIEIGNRDRRISELEAERDRAREDCRRTLIADVKTMNEMQAQLEAMRSALELALKPPAGAFWNGPAIAAMRAALSPSVPYTYRNQVLEEAAKHLDDRGVNEDSDYLHEASAIVRALKDGGT